MNKSKVASILFVVLGLLVVAGSLYVVISYANDLLNAVVKFVTTTDFTKLQQCGVSPPEEFSRIKADFVPLIIPFMYWGLPLIMVVVSLLMFLGGFYFHKGRDEEERKKNVELKREMVHKIVRKMGGSRPAEEAPGPAVPPEQSPAEESPATELVAEDEPEEEELPKPPKKKK